MTGYNNNTESNDRWQGNHQRACAGGWQRVDDAFTTADASIALQIATGSRPFDSRYDVSGDGSVTSLDALMLLQAATGRVEIG